MQNMIIDNVRVRVLNGAFSMGLSIAFMRVLSADGSAESFLFPVWSRREPYSDGEHPLGNRQVGSAVT